MKKPTIKSLSDQRFAAFYEDTLDEIGVRIQALIFETNCKLDKLNIEDPLTKLRRDRKRKRIKIF